MKFIRQGVGLCLALLAAILPRSVSASDVVQSYSVQSGVNQLYALANQARAGYGLAPLKWDPALAASASVATRIRNVSPIEWLFR